jgi:pimeloyl-ACP methyl ester carboxylesterase
MRHDAFDLVPPGTVEDLTRRLTQTRLVPVPPALHDKGVDPTWLRSKLSYWRDQYAWPEHEARIAALPWVQTEHTAVDIRAIVQRAPEPAPVVVLLHGWPDSVLRFERVLPLLRDVTVVVPALPGYPFAAPVPGEGMPATAMADAIVAALAEFGFRRFVLSAGDVGSDVAEAIAGRHPDAIEALHLTDISQFHYLTAPPDDPHPEEQAYIDHGHRWQADEGGYMHEQSTKPATLAVGLGDSPAGLAAWLLEKLITWTDCDGDLSRVFTDDEALTWVSAYWFSGAIGTSFVPYATGGEMDWPKIQAPTVFTVFPRDLVNAPRRFAERYFNVVEWHELGHGGHFAAWEHPTDYTAGVRAALTYRTRP